MTHAKEQMMTPLRARMIEDMKLAGLAERTQEVYLQAVRGLAKRYDRSPDQRGLAAIQKKIRLPKQKRLPQTLSHAEV
jgi:hypothetical protein